MSGGAAVFDLYADLFGTAAMRAIFSHDSFIARMLEVEAALASAQGKLGIIPADAARVIAANARLDVIDRDQLAEKTALAAAPVSGLAAQLSAACNKAEEGAGGYVHWGATTQDIADTALVLQMREAFTLLEQELDAVAGALARLADQHRDTVMAGRTYLQHALPISFGFKAAVWLAGVLDARDRLERARGRALTVQMFGAVGTLASLEGRGVETAEEVARALDLDMPDIAWHVRRGALSEVASALVELSGALAKIATDIALLSQSEIGELSEPHLPGRGGSSTMPQKRNPVASVLIVSLYRNITALAGVLNAGLAADHERPFASWQAEWQALPQAFVASAGALAHARFALEGLEVDANRMRANLELGHGMIMAEAVMMALGRTIGHGPAHDLVEEACAVARKRSVPLGEALNSIPGIADGLGEEEISRLLKPENYLGDAGGMINRVLTRMRGDARRK